MWMLGSSLQDKGRPKLESDLTHRNQGVATVHNRHPTALRRNKSYEDVRSLQQMSQSEAEDAYEDVRSLPRMSQSEAEDALIMNPPLSYKNKSRKMSWSDECGQALVEYST